MGSIVSSEHPPAESPHGSILLKTDRPSYIPGDTVSGEIYLNIKQQWSNAKLFLSVEGAEGVRVVKIIRSHKGTSPPHLEKSKKKFLNKKALMLSWDILQKDHYVIPFSFLLQDNIPASFFEENKSHFAAYVRYKLRILLVSLDKPGNKLGKAIHLVVREKPKPAGNQAVSKEIKTKLNTWYCVSKGFNILKAHFEKTCFNPNDIARVHVEFDNSTSKLLTTDIIVRLIQKVNLRGDWKTVIFEQKLHFGVEAGQSKKFSSEITIPGFRGYDHSIDEKKEKWPKAKHTHIGTITNSSYIKSEYFLEVCCLMEDKLFSSHKNPVILCPIQINYPDHLDDPVSLPEEWKPCNLPMIFVAFNSKKASSKGKESVDGKRMVDAGMVDVHTNV